MGEGPSERTRRARAPYDRPAGAGADAAIVACRTSASSLAVSARRTARPSGASR